MRTPLEFYALVDFVQAINNAGGVIEDSRGRGVAPMDNPEWFDLGEAYLRACRTLDWPPKVSPAE